MAYWVLKSHVMSERNVIANRIAHWWAGKVPKGLQERDRLFIWANTPTCRIVGVAKVLNPDAGLDIQARPTFTIRYHSDYIDGPTLADLREIPGLHKASFLKSGPTGTIYPLTDTQGAILLGVLCYSQLPNRTPTTTWMRWQPRHLAGAA